jgi:hypothetical protein
MTRYTQVSPMPPSQESNSTLVEVKDLKVHFPMKPLVE